MRSMFKAIISSILIGTFVSAAAAGKETAAKANGKTVRKITLAELEDKVRGGWAGQMIGVTYGAPSEFRFQQKINDEAREWKPEELAGALDQDDLYVEMTFSDVMDRLGLNATF